MSLENPAQSKNVASEVSGGFKHADTPMDFIKNNIRSGNSNGPVPGTVIVPDPRTNPSPVPEQKVENLSPSPVPAGTPPDPKFQSEESLLPFSESAPPLEDPKRPPETPEGGDQTLEGEDEQEEVKGPKVSIKNLRKIANEAKEQLELEKAQRQKLSEEIEAYKNGEAIPERIAEYEERISKLEHFESLVDFKLSKEYQEQFEIPAEDLKEQARKIASDYGVETEVLDRALRIDNKKDLNAFLRQHFDDVGTLEAREVLTKLRNLDIERQTAEQKPQAEWERIKNERKLVEQARVNEQTKVLQTSARGGWIKALNEVRESSIIPELQFRANDEEHNKIVRPIIETASKDYANMIKALAASGARNIPEDVLKVLARWSQKSFAADVIAASRDQHYQRAEEMKTNSRRDNAVRRPPVGGGSVNATPSAPQSMTAEQAAQSLIDQVQAKKRAK